MTNSPGGRRTSMEDWDDQRLLREFASLSEEFANAQRELAKRNAQLERANEQKDDLLRAAAHDLRNPLSAVTMLTDCLIADEKSPPSQAQLPLVEAIGRSSRYMLKIVESLLEVSVLEKASQSINVETVDMTELVGATVSINQVLADRKNVVIARSLTSGIYCSADRTRIEQVINNLLSNAIAYSPEHAVVQVDLICDRDLVLVSVSDRGCGISTEDQSRLFRPFPRIASRPTGGEKSVGLGLAISRAIVEAHGGRIWVESVVGEGSTFCVELPEAAQPES